MIFNSKQNIALHPHTKCSNSNIQHNFHSHDFLPDTSLSYCTLSIFDRCSGVFSPTEWWHLVFSVGAWKSKIRKFITLRRAMQYSTGAKDMLHRKCIVILIVCEMSANSASESNRWENIYSRLFKPELESPAQSGWEKGKIMSTSLF